MIGYRSLNCDDLIGSISTPFPAVLFQLAKSIRVWLEGNNPRPGQNAIGVVGVLPKRGPDVNEETYTFEKAGKGLDLSALVLEFSEIRPVEVLQIFVESHSVGRHRSSEMAILPSVRVAMTEAASY